MQYAKFFNRDYKTSGYGLKFAAGLIVSTTLAYEQVTEKFQEVCFEENLSHVSLGSF